MAAVFTPFQEDGVRSVCRFSFSLLCVLIIKMLAILAVVQAATLVDNICCGSVKYL
jgi:hypothetical protein